jgi:hypothetical protein
VLPVIDEFVSILSLAILSLFSLPAILVSWVLVDIFDPAFNPRSSFYLALVGGFIGLIVTALAVYALRHTKFDGPIIVWAPKYWATYIRVAQATGVGCVLVVRFMLP